MIPITKEALCQLLVRQGLHGSQEGENLYQNLLPLAEGQFTGPEVKDVFINCASTISPRFNALQALIEFEII